MFFVGFFSSGLRAEGLSWSQHRLALKMEQFRSVTRVICHAELWWLPVMVCWHLELGGVFLMIQWGVKLPWLWLSLLSSNQIYSICTLLSRPIRATHKTFGNVWYKGKESSSQKAQKGMCRLGCFISHTTGLSQSTGAAWKPQQKQLSQRRLDWTGLDKKLDWNLNHVWILL